MHLNDILILCFLEVQQDNFRTFVSTQDRVLIISGMNFHIFICIKKFAVMIII